MYGDVYVAPALSVHGILLHLHLVRLPGTGLYSGAALTATPIVLLVLTGIFAIVVQSKRRAAMKAEAETAA